MNKVKESDVKTKSDEYFMREALKEAKKAYLKNEVPVGAVIVKNNEIIEEKNIEKTGQSQ